MEEVYLLQHVRSDDEYGDDYKVIGIYRSEESARAAVARLGGNSGFRDHPDGWHIGRFQLDQDHWKEGFVDLTGDQELP